MPLLFDQFGVRRVELEVSMWPGFSHGFHKGELSALYGALNTDDLFESCELRANLGAEFESEHWHYDISTSRILVASEAFQDFDDLDRTCLHLLAETRAFLTPSRLPFLFSDRAVVRGIVPVDAPLDVSATLQTKVLTTRLRKVTDDQRLLDLLPGELSGIGLELVGDGDEYHWHAKIGPAHSDTPELSLSASLFFPPPSEIPEDSMISDSLRTAYEFCTTELLDFARQTLS